MSADSPHVPPNAEETPLAAFILSMATFAGMQEDGNGGSFQLWNLTKSLAGHPKGSTVSRATLERAYKAGAKFCSTTVPAGKPKDFDAVEKPA